MLLNTFTQIKCTQPGTKTLSATSTYNVFGLENDKIEMKQTRLQNTTRSTYKITAFCDEDLSKNVVIGMETEYWLKKGAFIMDANQKSLYQLEEDVKITLKEAKFVLFFDDKKAMVRKTTKVTKTKLRNHETNEEVEVVSNSILYFLNNKYSVIGNVQDNNFREVKIDKCKDVHLLLQNNQDFEYLGPYGLNQNQDTSTWEFMYLATKDLFYTNENTFDIDLNLCYWKNSIKLDTEVKVTQIDEKQKIEKIKTLFETACTEIKTTCNLIASHLDKEIIQEELKEVVSFYHKLKSITRCSIFTKDASNAQLLEQLSSRLIILYGYAMDAFAKNLEYDYDSVKASYTQFAYREFTQQQNKFQNDLAKTYIMEKNGVKFDELDKKWHENIYLFNVTLEAREHFEINPPVVDNILIKEDISIKIREFKEKYQNDLDLQITNETMNDATQQLFDEIKTINDELLELMKRYYVSGSVIETISKRLQKTQEKYFDSDILCYSIIKELSDAQRNKYEILRKIKDIRNKPSFIEDLMDNAEMKISEMDNVINTRLTDNEILVKLKSLSECIVELLKENKDKLSQENKNIYEKLKTKMEELINYIPIAVDNDSKIKRLITEAKEKIGVIDNVIKDKKVNENDLINLKDKCNGIIKDLDVYKGTLTVDEENTKQELLDGIVKLDNHIDFIVLSKKSITALIQDANIKISDIDAVIKNKESNKATLKKLKTDSENLINVLKQKENEFDDANKGKETMLKLQDEIDKLTDYINNLKEEAEKPHEDPRKTTESDLSPPKDTSKISKGALIGIILGGITGILIVIIVIWVFSKQREIVEKEISEILGNGEITVVSKSSFYRI